MTGEMVVVVPVHGPLQKLPGSCVMFTAAPFPLPVPAVVGSENFAGSLPPVLSEPPGTTKPVVAVLTYSYTSLVAATNDFLHADIYKCDDATDITGSIVKDCKDNPAWSNGQKAAAALRRIARVGTQSGIANPVPCLDARSITVISKFKYTLSFTVLYLSGDPHLGRK